METTKNASSCAFEQINKNLINTVRGKHYMECLGAYCWMKANRVFSDEYAIAVGNYRREVLYKNEVSYSLRYLAKAWNFGVEKTIAVLKEMEKLNMIKLSRTIKGANTEAQNVYYVFDCSETEQYCTEIEHYCSETDQHCTETDQHCSETDQHCSETSTNNNTNNHTNNNTKKENKSKATCLPNSTPSCASAVEGRKDKQMSEDEEYMALIDTTPVNRHNGIGTAVDIINKTNNSTMTEEHKMDFETLDDKAYARKYGKSKPLTYDADKERRCLIYSELYRFICTLKSKGKTLTAEWVGYYKEHSAYCPTVDEIKEAVASIKNTKETSSKRA